MDVGCVVALYLICWSSIMFCVNLGISSSRVNDYTVCIKRRAEEYKCNCFTIDRLLSMPRTTEYPKRKERKGEKEKRVPVA